MKHRDHPAPLTRRTFLTTGLAAATASTLEAATHQGLIDAYARALDAHPRVRLMLLTHLSHRTGLVLPVRGIVEMASEGRVGVEENKALAGQLLEQHRIFTVHRAGLASGACVRVTPSFFTRPDDVEQLLRGLKRLAGAA